MVQSSVEKEDQLKVRRRASDKGLGDILVYSRVFVMVLVLMG